MKTLVVLAVTLAVQGRTLYEDSARSIRVYNYVQGEGGTLENGDFEFRITGRPAAVESRLQGLTVTGPSIEGKLAPAASPQSAGFLRELIVSGGTTLTLDSQLRNASLTEHSKRFGTPLPANPSSRDMATVRTDRMAYVGDSAKGTFTVPGSFTLEADSSGARGETQFQQKLTANGSSATFELNPQANNVIPIKKGTIAGPVTVDIDRTETRPSAPQPERTKIHGVADAVDLDLEGSRTVTLRGNVKVQGESTIYQGTSEGDTVVIFLDESLKPIRIRISGEPAKSTLRDKRDGGGPN